MTIKINFFVETTYQLNRYSHGLDSNYWRPNNLNLAQKTIKLVGYDVLENGKYSLVIP